ncbi:MAG: DedA family protein [Bacteroidota bacterium]
MHAVIYWITQWGYPAIFSLLVLGVVGVPVPDETLLAFVGYLAYKGNLDLLPAIATAFFGSICGITISYILGKTLGLKILHKYGKYVHITPDKLDKTHQWFERFGKWLLMIGYFIPGVRHLTAYVAGASDMELPHFMLFAYTGGFIWSLGFIMLGYLLGDKWEMVMHSAHRHIRTASIIAGVLLAAYLLWRYLKRKRTPVELPREVVEIPKVTDGGDGSE